LLKSQNRIRSMTGVKSIAAIMIRFLMPPTILVRAKLKSGIHGLGEPSGLLARGTRYERVSINNLA
jgi:hypothetical protein